ncbi:hypothetical protein LCGC14_2828560 [marine sediment metagenome]|uniref:Uncharacterized protein n=1 Tax=marine sediment metagenome TaxID=412755 RepID=A0A0F8YEU7_9ZZZZ
MDEKKEEKKPEESKDKQPAKDTGDRVQSEADKQIEQLNADTERINKAIEASRKVGGLTDAGEAQIKKPEVSNEDYARNVLSGKENERKK